MQPSVFAELSPWVVRLVAFVFGAIWGSFFNVAIYRWPRAMSIVLPSSQCPHCKAPIPPYLNIPIFSYFILRGRAACCGAKISPRYLLVEVMGALLCVALAERFILGAAQSAPLLERSLIALCYFAFGGGLIVATFIDLEFMEIPDEISLPITALGLVTAIFRDPPGVEAAALGAGGGYLLVQVLFVWIYERLSGRRGMGEGDSKLLMAIGAFIGWRGGVFCLLAGAAQGLIVALPIVFLQKKADSPLSTQIPFAGAETADHPIPNAEKVEKTKPGNVGEGEISAESSDPPPKYFGHLKIPFGPFLAISAIEYLFFGEQLVNAYLDFGQSLSALFHGAS
jgi:leader peptidase (prepilin peptidase)/N-methyltransferase